LVVKSVFNSAFPPLKGAISLHIFKKLKAANPLLRRQINGKYPKVFVKRIGYKGIN
jgi:hypothetical protein